MKTTRCCSALLSTDVPAAAAFYRASFQFAALFTSDGSLHLQSTEDSSANRAIEAQDYPSVPALARHRTGGAILNFAVSDPQGHRHRLIAHGLQVTPPLHDEDLGQRHFIVAAPDGRLVDGTRPAPPGAKFAAHCAADAPPE